MFLKSNSSCLMSNFPADILIIDDERQIRRLLNLTLTGAGYHVRECENGQLGLSETALKRPDAIILDLGLPDINGLEVLKQLREWTQVPILILTAWDREDEKVDALDAGADDYLTKPFSIQELLARIRVSLRHFSLPENEPVFERGNLRIDFSKRQVFIDGKEISLTPTEYDLLRVLVQHQGRVITHRQLLREVWGEAYEGEAHLLRVNISNLRHKIEKDPSQPELILTDAGVGYRIKPA